MKFFIDTANINEIKGAAALGILDGVTTNPSLVAKEGKDFRILLDEIIKIVDGPISAEVISTDYNGILKEARNLSFHNCEDIKNSVNCSNCLCSQALLITILFIA